MSRTDAGVLQPLQLCVRQGCAAWPAAPATYDGAMVGHAQTLEIGGLSVWCNALDPNLILSR